jgi:carbon-monoxide dehydrogenase medium subunit
VKPAPFEYHRASSLADAAELLRRDGTKVLAGGQSLVPMMSMRLVEPHALVDVNRLPELDRITVSPDAVRVGATVRHRALELHEAAYEANPLLRQALSCVAHPTIRNRGTTVGSLAHADPAAEMPVVLSLLGGAVEVLSAARGRRSIPADELFTGPLETSAAPDELVVSATFPNPPSGSGTAWVELARRHGDYALVGVAAMVTLGDAAVTAARVGLLSVAETPLVVDLSATVQGRPADRVDWSEAVGAVDARLDPEADIHATAEYRRHLARVLTGRALDAALGAAVRRHGEVANA